jgi:hypothetical protein
MNTGAAIGNLGWLAGSLPELLRFRRDSGNLESTQRKLLRDFLARNADTAFGRQHSFQDIRGFEDYAERVPVRSYDEFVPWINRIAAGEEQVLSADPVRLFEPTSGSSGPAKLIPYTASLQREIRRAVAAWSAGNFLSRPDLLFGRAYWSLTPQMTVSQPPESVIPVGFDEDSAYLGGMTQTLINRTLATHPGLRQVGDMDEFWRLTLLMLLRCRDLRLVSVWHPSYLALLVERLRCHWPSLLADLASGVRLLEPAIGIPRDSVRARELEAAGCDDLLAIWPKLQLISCWADGHAAASVPQLRALFPGVAIQAKGLVATEGIVTIPFADRRPLACRSHVFEFFDDGGKVHRPWQLELNHTYSVAITTGGGLYRYRLGDRVKVDGFLGDVPSLQFVGREDSVSDYYGEKLSEDFVGDVIRRVSSRLDHPPRFAMLALDDDPANPAYVLYIEVDGDLPDSLPHTLQRELCANPHYELCTRLGQLGNVRVFRIAANGYDAYAGRLSAMGMRIGDIKPTPLSSHSGWDHYFTA